MKMFKRLVSSLLDRVATMLPSKTSLPLLGSFDQTASVEETTEKNPCPSCNPTCQCATSETEAPLPVSMKVAAQKIGLDLVPVKSSHPIEMTSGYIDVQIVDTVEVPKNLILINEEVASKPKRVRKPKAKADTTEEVVKPKSRKKKSE